MIINDIYGSSISAAQEIKKYSYISTNNSSLYSIQLQQVPNRAFAYQSISSIAFTNCQAIGDEAFLGCDNLSRISAIKCSIIGKNAFKNCSSLSIAQLGNCQIINEYAFQNCINLPAITLNNCLIIKNNAFENCSSLSGIGLSNCYKMGEQVFSNCINLKMVNVSKCFNIPKQAFYNCVALTSIYASNCRFVDNSAFFNCQKLKNINFSMCSLINSNAFENNYSLQSVKLENCLQIKNQAFYNCSSLSSVSLPKCNYIGNSAFNQCIKLSKIYLTSTQMTNLESIDAFINSPMSNSAYLSNTYGSIYVFKDLYSAYINDSQWSYYKDRIIPLTGYGPFVVTYYIPENSGIVWTGQSEYTYFDSYFTIQGVTPTKSNYIFKGWNTNSTASTAIYDANQQIRIYNNMTLYPIFSANIITNSIDVIFINGSKNNQISNYTITNGMTFSAFINSSYNTSSQIKTYQSGDGTVYVTYGNIVNDSTGYVLQKDRYGNERATINDVLTNGTVYYAIYATDYIFNEGIEEGVGW